MAKFIKFVNKNFRQNFSTYDELYQWSINDIADFWEAVWEFGGIIASKKYDTVVDDLTKMPGAKWFPGARLNFAENLLRYRDNKVALVFRGEVREPQRLTYHQLYQEVAKLSKSMRGSGITVGDRVAGYMPNVIETVVAMLATTSIGAIWASCSPDFGIRGALERFCQIEPKLLFCANGYSYNGKLFNSLEKVAGILENLPSVEKVVVVPYTEKRTDLSQLPKSIHYQDFISKKPNLEIQFEQLSFDHPVYIMFTSGTTGLPKCIVQGPGVLINHIKELKLHTDLKREDVIFYFTTCSWMMWNWLISALALGGTLVLYDGSPFYPHPGILWKLAQDEKMTIFGTSAKYLAEIEKRGLRPGKEYNLKPLKTILSTGSPLLIESFEYVYREIKKDLLLASISGGTDLNGCFALGNPIGPVYAGELQCRGLGMQVEVFDAQGNSIRNQPGELVCTVPFPSMPLYFWQDSDGQKYQNAYFSVYPNVWCHGDYAEITEENGMIIYGRSDATLNPGGVRIGTAEIYRQVEPIEEIADGLVVGQEWEGDIRVILFVKLKEGIELTDNLVKKIQTRIRENTTPRHIPAKIIAVPDIPYTLNMKKVELAVKNAIHGRPVKNLEALANPEALEFYKNIKELQEE